MTHKFHFFWGGGGDFWVFFWILVEFFGFLGDLLTTVFLRVSCGLSEGRGQEVQEIATDL